MFTEYCQFIINKYLKPHQSHKYLKELKKSIKGIKYNDLYYYGDIMCPTIINYEGRWYTSSLSSVEDYRTQYILKHSIINKLFF